MEFRESHGDRYIDAAEFLSADVSKVGYPGGPLYLGPELGYHDPLAPSIFDAEPEPVSDEVRRICALPVKERADALSRPLTSR